MNTRVEGKSRFESDASRYAAYLTSPEGRLRTDLAFANLRDFLPPSAGVNSLHALDLGGGTGESAMRLAHLGMSVTLLDSSPAMLELAGRAASETKFRDQITVKHGDAARLTEIFEERSFDAILCHNLLEYVDDPVAVLRSAQRLMRNSSAILSVLVRSQSGEVLKAALKTGDLEAAERNLTADWGEESLYGGRVRLFVPEALETMLKEASFTIHARRAVRIVADYLPAQISRSAEYEKIFALEQKLGQRLEYFGMARYMQCFASSAIPRSEGVE